MILALILILFFSSFAHAEEKRVVVLDLETKRIDTLDNIKFDKTRTKDRTLFKLGSKANYFAPLSTEIPADHIPDGSEFTYKQRVADYYDASSFPISTAVKLFQIRDGELKSKCSGILVGPNYVLSAAHCAFHFSSKKLFNDSLMICPAFDNGNENTNFSCSRVNKVYYFENWSLGDSDFLLMELEDDIGYDTGWIGFGFESNDEILRENLYYKFSYPAKYEPQIDSNRYNGDTLYFYHGKIDRFEQNYIGVNQHMGIPGESGSSIISVNNESEYTSYGVLTFSKILRHSRIRDWVFYSFKSIIDSETSIDIDKNNYTIFSIHLNPASKVININTSEKRFQIDIYDLLGNNLLSHSNTKEIEISKLPSGLYFIRLTNNRISESFKFYKIN